MTAKDYLRAATSGLLAASFAIGTAIAQGGPDAGRADRDLERAYEEGFRDGRRAGLDVGQPLGREHYRVLDPDLYVDRYGRSLSEGYAYAEVDDGTRILIDLATGVVRDILGDASHRRSEDRRYQPRASGRIKIPPGHMPPPGECRVWFPGRPPGQQPPPGSCNVRVPRGAVLVGG